MKIIKYQLSKNQFIVITVETLEDLVAIKKLNNEFDKDKKKEKTYQKNTILLSRLEEDYHFELIDQDESVIEAYERNELKEFIRVAIEKLTLRQRQVVVEHILYEKSFRQIARENHLAYSTIYEIYKAALKKLRKELIFLKD